MPPVAETVTVEFPPLQAIALVEADGDIAVGELTVTEEEAEQPFPSVALTV